jgi:hypothetical protein
MVGGGGWELFWSRNKVYTKYGERIDRGWFCVWSCLLSASPAAWHEGWDWGLQCPSPLMSCLHVGMRLRGHANDDYCQRGRGLCTVVHPLQVATNAHNNNDWGCCKCHLAPLCLKVPNSRYVNRLSFYQLNCTHCTWCLILKLDIWIFVSLCS